MKKITKSEKQMTAEKQTAAEKQTTAEKQTGVEKQMPAEDVGTSTQDKNFCRMKHLRFRRSMPQEEVQESSQMICEALSQSDWYSDCSVIYAYMPIKQEVDIQPFLVQAFADGKRIALPRVEGLSMDFYEITSFDDLVSGCFHIKEPAATCSICTESGGIFLIPGVVFDKQGNRCGYGKGYYDRYFSRFPQKNMFGIAFENQMEQELIAEPHDRPMHRIYTEKTCYLM